MSARVFHEGPVVGSVVQYLDGRGEVRAAIVTHVYSGSQADYVSPVDLAYFPHTSTTLGVASYVGHESGRQDLAVWRWPR